ncbi:MAG: helix-turn-helix transcriptional regulator [Acidobacteriota bacterium]|nr:helix-turn-helix transcriptional regulator [Acidobacteriota bacterium]
MSHKCRSILVNRSGTVRAHVASVAHDFQHGQSLPEHLHPEDQLLFASRGVMTVQTTNGLFVVPPLRAVWIPAGVAHSIAMSGRVSLRTLYFLPGLVRHLPAICVVFHVSPLLKELLLHASGFPHLRRETPIQRRIIDVIIDQLNTARAAPLQLPQPRDPRALRIATNLLADPSQQGTLEQLCEEVGASKRTAQRLFIAETNMSFAKWRQQLRLLHALQSLAAGQKVASAARAAGYNSASAFIAMFRKQFGATPAQYFRD